MQVLCGHCVRNRTDGLFCVVFNPPINIIPCLSLGVAVIRLATSFEPYLARATPSALAMFKADNMFDTTPSSSPAPKPDPQPNPEPDAAIDTTNVCTAPATDISPADWDALFHAITARLQACSGPASVDHLPEHMLGVTASLQVTVRECAVSLNRLHAALVRERQQHQQRYRAK